MKSIVALACVFLLTVSVGIQAQTIGPCQIFPHNNPWNQRVDSLPVHWNSDKYINSVGGTRHLHPDFGSDPSYGIPWVAVGSSQPFVPVTITAYPDESDPGPMPIPANAPVEQPAPPSGDGHVLVVDTGNCKLYELYQGIKGSGSGWSASSTAIFDLSKNEYRPDGWTSCDAAGLPIWPGLVKKYECDAGEIKHAIRFTVPKSQAGWIFPARHKASSITDTTYMPMGLRLRLKASFDDSHFTGYAKVISTAMKRYGIIMADNGSAWFISGETNTSWPDADISQLKAIAGSDFEAVYTGPVATHANQYPTPSFAGISATAIVRDTARVGAVTNTLVWVRNDGANALTMSGATLRSDSGFAVSGIKDPLLLQAGDSMALQLTFAPHMHRVYLDTLMVSSSDATHPSLEVALEGIGTAGVFATAHAPIDMGRVAIGGSGVFQVPIRNIGDGDEVILKVQSSSAKVVFSGFHPAGVLPRTLHAGDSLIALFAYTPDPAGKDTASVMLSVSEFKGDDHIVSVPVTGEGYFASSVANATPDEVEISVAPNPSAGMLSIRMTGPEHAGWLRIVDVLGRTQFASKLTAGTTSLDLRSLPAGSYIVNVFANSRFISRSIEIRH